jgi:hypothetical protein
MKDLEKFSQIWDDAQGKGIFDDEPVAQKGSKETSFFGLKTSEVDQQINESDASDWKKLSNLMKEESEAKPEDIKKSSKKMANTYNPVYNYSLDSDSKPKMDWQKETVELEKIDGMKKKLHSVQDQLAKLAGTDKMLPKKNKDSDIEKKIKKLQDEIDKLSNSYNGNRVKEKT